ncbi:MAG: hypothetical protein IKP64_08815 [Selenomonadaceae bacterium]|nr:hypothetical protein [Selenomonadaceae bacterium]
MKKFLSVLVLLTALIVGGCSDKPVIVNSHTADNRIILEADGAYGDSERNGIEISDGEVLKVDAQITSGKLILEVEGQEYEFDKSGETFIEVSAGNRIVTMTPKSGLTGKIIFSAVPKD